MSTNHTRITRTSWVFAILAVLTIPWAAYLAYSLPKRSVAHHYDVAWAGFDIGLIVALVLCAVAAWKAHRFLPLASVSTATFLVVDAWFDVVTSAGTEQLIAIVLAAVVELPLAGLCIWLALNVQRLVHEADQRRTRRAERRRQHAERRRAGADHRSRR